MFLFSLSVWHVILTIMSIYLRVRTTGVSIYSLNNIGIMSYIDNEILERLIGTMVEGFARIEKKLDQMNRLKECMNGDRLLDNVDLAELLGVSQRTWHVIGKRARLNITRWKRMGNHSILPQRYRVSCFSVVRT